MAKQWYVVHTYSGHENKVKVNLEKAIIAKELEEMFGQILVATEDYAELRDPESLAPAPVRLAAPTLFALAVRFQVGERDVRLIDNRILHPQEVPS